MSEIEKIVQNNLKGFNKIETKNALRPGLRISIVGNLVSRVSMCFLIFEQYQVSNLQFRVSTIFTEKVFFCVFGEKVVF